MNLFSLLRRRRSAPVARERLQVLLSHERGNGGDSELLAVLRDEILQVISRHLTIEDDKVQVKLERGQAVSLLEIDIEVPGRLDQQLRKRRRPAGPPLLPAPST
ncbi:MAG: cell division topological specificity factor MinE [Acetobacteraceae bacterium]